MSNVILGTIPNESDDRDAVHVAIVPQIAAELLRPGQRVGLVRDGAGPSENPVGIVDPYLTDVVPKGTRFWLCLFPNTVTGMRHHWSHPWFSESSDNRPTREDSERWLREFVRTADCPPYEELIAAATGGELSVVDEIYGPNSYTLDGEYLFFNGRGAHGGIPNEFWNHVENVTGKKCVRRPKWFACSC